MNESLLHRIRPVGRQFRRLRFWQTWVLIVSIALLAAFWLKSRVDIGDIEGRSAAIGMTYVLAGIAILAAVACSFLYRDPRRVARQIENHFPSLDQRLLTALSQRDDKLGYLQQRVIKEARDHSRSNRWTDAVSSRALWLSRLSGLAGTAMLAGVLGLLAATTPDPRSREAARLRSMTPPIVEPGDTEIERGSSLVVTAKFSDRSVDRGELMCEDESGQLRMIPMTQNLDDPILGGFVAAIDQPMTYQIRTTFWTSRTYKIDVFDYPELNRADAELVYPEYTKLESKLIEDTMRVSAVEGTRVKWLVMLNKPVVTADFVSKDGQRFPISFDADEATTGNIEFVVDENRRFKLELIDQQGRKNRYPPELTIRALPNQVPKLKVTPASDSAVSPLEELSISADVSDDFGIAEVGFASSIDGASPTEIILQRDIAAKTKTMLSHLVALEDLNVQPDQLLSYHFFAIDVGPDGQPRRTDSDMYFAEVRPFDEIFREGQPPPGGEGPPPSGSAQESDELAELQKEIISATWRVIRDRRAKPQSEGFTEAVELLKEAQTDALAKLDELASKIRDPDSQLFVAEARASMESALTEIEKETKESGVDALSTALPYEQAAYSGLLKLRAREFEVSRSQQPSKSQSSAAQKKKQQKLDDLELKQDENRYETQSQAQAATAEEAAAQETRQILSRLRDLARRQEDLNKELAQLQSALEEAETEAEREEIQRQLKRLRDQQQELLRETDELAEQMEQSSSDAVDEATKSKLEETRQDVQKAAEALNQDDASGALTSGKRAERQFEEMRDELRKASAGQFDDAMRELRNEAQKLDEKQQELIESIDSDQRPEATAGLRSEQSPSKIDEQLSQQKASLDGLLEQVQEVVTEAEETEPLLAQKLYDSYRKARQSGIDKKLDDAAQWIERGLKPQAKAATEQAGEGVGELRKELEQAAEAVLGDETKALQRAAGELERLDKHLQDELSANRPGQRSDAEGNPAEPSQAQSADGKRSPGSQQPSSGSGHTPADGQAESESESESQSNDGKQPGQSGQGSPSGGQADRQPSGSAISGFGGGGRASAPLTGDGYRQWSDSLREIEEMVDDAGMRSQAAQIRDRAREMRTDFRRNAKEPEWELVDELIATPLRELKRNVSEELLRRSAQKNANVPIDRDPVPREFSDAVERYYERLGSGD